MRVYGEPGLSPECGEIMSDGSQFVKLHQEPYIKIAKPHVSEKTAYSQVTYVASSTLGMSLL